MDNPTQLKMFERLDLIIDKIRLATAEVPKKNELYAALSKAKLEYRNVRFNRENSFNKQVYADLDQINKATEKALSNNGLVFIQEPRDVDGTTFLFSVLGHSSGQEIEVKNRLIIPGYTGAKSDLQRFGEALAYLKRQIAQCLLGVVANNDPEDNDDADASESHFTKESMRSLAGDEKPAVIDQGILSEKITKEQLQQLHWELNDFPVMTASLLKGLEIKQLSDMPKARYQEHYESILQNKRRLEGKSKKEW